LTPFYDPDDDPEQYANYLVSINYAYNNPEITDPVTPAGVVTMDYTSP
jgi:hypothetical protein